MKSKKTIRVAFLNLGSEEWTGGLHYLRNLLYALSYLEDDRVESYVFVGKKCDVALIEPIKAYAKIVHSSIIDHQSTGRILWKGVYLLTGSHCILNNLLKKYKIDIISHSGIVGEKMPFKLVNWIPDLQHQHLPKLFSENEYQRRDSRYENMLIHSDRVLVSSKDTLRDLNNFLPGFEEKIDVINFVSQPKSFSCASNKYCSNMLEEKYVFHGKFFYLPNQFWLHKNHMVVFEAVNILRESGLDILLLCSGHMEDHRNKSHIKKLKQYIGNNDLSNNIKLLGLIDYVDVFLFIRNSIAVINPSFFEGWSSTVEEVKSVGKRMILSNIRVHKEQDPPESVYFNPSSPKELAEILRRYWSQNNGGPDVQMEKHAQKMLPGRTRSFGEKYLNILLNLM